MTESALYYTLSTIAQALPTGFGLLAGAAIFRVTAVTSVAAEKSAEFMQFLMKWEGSLDVTSLVHLARSRDFSQLENEFHDSYSRTGGNTSMRAESVTAISAAREATDLLGLAAQVHKFLRIALLLTVATTSIAIVCMPFSETLAEHDSSWLLLAFIVLLAVFTLSMSGWLTSLLIKEAGTENPLGQKSRL